LLLAATEPINTFHVFVFMSAVNVDASSAVDERTDRITSLPEALQDGKTGDMKNKSGVYGIIMY
jgi:hypothetical protein